MANTAETGAKIGVEFERPKYTAAVSLPYVWKNEYKKVVLGLHSDMALSFQDILRSLKPELRKGLLVQGRVLTHVQWNMLRQDPVFEFFLRGRSYRTDETLQKEMVKLIVPRSVLRRISTDALHNYVFARHPFTPETRSDVLGFRVGWYNADALLRKSPEIETTSPKSLIPILGGVTQFLIGTNTLKAGYLPIIAANIMHNFEEWELVVDTPARLERERILRAGYEIVVFK